MTATDTRNAAYFEHRDSGALSKQQSLIMLALHGRPHVKDFSLTEIAHLTGMPVHTVSARVNELKNREPFPYLVESDKRKCSFTKKSVTPVKINRGQMDLFGRAA